MVQKNPFTLSFGRRPVEYISRTEESDLILGTFTEDPVTDQIFVITGVRGSGKTVLMSSVANALERDKGWYVERCTAARDIVGEIAADLSGRSITGKMSVSGSFTVPGVGSVSIQNNNTEKTDITKIREALKVLQSHGRKLLVTVDEVTSTKQMQDFCSVFQILIGEELPIYFLGTAIPENMDTLKNVKYLTFLYRAPRIELEPLDMASIAWRYQTVFDISSEQSREMAKLTLGYSFAFQALGYVCWKEKPVSDLESVLPEYDRLLASYSYSKIWTELTEKQQNICRAIAKSRSGAISEIREVAGMDSNNFNGYQNRLIHQGVLRKTRWGMVSFALPRFAEFVLTYSELYDF